MKHQQVIAKIEKLGGEFVWQTGSHRRYKAVDTTIDESREPRRATAITTVQVHKDKDMPMGALRAIEKQLEPAFGKGWLR